MRLNDELKRLAGAATVSPLHVEKVAGVYLLIGVDPIASFKRQADAELVCFFFNHLDNFLCTEALERKVRELEEENDDLRNEVDELERCVDAHDID